MNIETASNIPTEQRDATLKEPQSLRFETQVTERKIAETEKAGRALYLSAEVAEATKLHGSLFPGATK